MSQLVPFLNFGLEDSQLMDADFLYVYDANDNKMFKTFEGLNSGVPTRTTSTLTPTTLRNIEQTFFELQSESETHENEAGFVPPLVPIGNNQYIPASDVDIYSKSTPLWQNSLSQSSSDSNTRPTPPVTPKQGIVSNPPQSRRNMGGRKPAKEPHLSPEEEERRRIRRERNKAAAARCRKRRVDHTNSLIEETEKLEKKKFDIQREIQETQSMKDELECILEHHRLSKGCRLTPDSRSSTPPDVKPCIMLPNFSKLGGKDHRLKMESMDHLPMDDDDFAPPAKRVMLSHHTVPSIPKPTRPQTLEVSCVKSSSELPGILISTPSAGIHFNFESMMDGRTGLTPVSGPLAPSSCGTQQRIPTSSADIISPDSCGPSKLVSL